MRGLLLTNTHIFSWRGITPAHAGLTILDDYERQALRDHPRACGAYPLHPDSSLLVMGSPPRMRGLLHYCNAAWWADGITPAHAGLTNRLLQHSFLFGDHPRACGAYIDLS